MERDWQMTISTAGFRNQGSNRNGARSRYLGSLWQAIECFLIPAHCKLKAQPLNLPKIPLRRLLCKHLNLRDHWNGVSAARK
jgi:hypothetical protein